jgi:hypothetical protein
MPADCGGTAHLEQVGFKLVHALILPHMGRWHREAMTEGAALDTKSAVPGLDPTRRAPPNSGLPEFDT